MASYHNKVHLIDQGIYSYLAYNRLKSELPGLY